MDDAAAPALAALDPQQLVTLLAEAAAVIDLDSSILAVNDAAAELLGWSADDLLGRPVATVLPDRLHTRFGEVIRRVRTRGFRRPGNVIRAPLRTKEGMEVDVDVAASPVTAGGTPGALLVLRPAGQVTHLDDIAATAEGVLEALDPDASFEDSMAEILARLGDLLGYDFAGLSIVDSRLDRLRLVAAWVRETLGTRADDFKEVTTHKLFARGEGLPGWSWQQAEPVIVGDVSNDPRLVRGPEAARAGLHTAVCFPVLDGATVVGVIELYSEEGRTPDDALSHHMALVGSRLGPVLAHRIELQRVREERTHLALALDGSQMGTWHWDVATGVVTWSATIQRILGRPGTFVGTVDDFLEVVHADDRSRIGRGLDRVLDSQGEAPVRLEFRIVRADGQVRWVEVRGVALSDDDGQTETMTGVAADVSERKAAEVELQRQHAHLDLALESSGYGVWEWSLDTDEVTIAVPLHLTLGLPRHGTTRDFVEAIHPDDRARVVEEVGEAVESGRSFRFLHRILTPTGDVRWVDGRGSIIHGVDGSVASILGVMADVTGEHLDDLAIRAERARLRAAMEAADLGVWHWDVRTGETTMSPNFGSAFGMPGIGSMEAFFELTHPDDRKALRLALDEGARDGGTLDMEYRVVLPESGQVRWVQVKGHAIRDDSGDVAAFTGVSHDVTERRRTEERLRARTRLLASLNEVGKAVTSRLELGEVLQLVTDAATNLTHAEMGAFFYRRPGPLRRSHVFLRALSGVSPEMFEDLDVPRSSRLVGATLDDGETVRLGDVYDDPRYGLEPPHHGLPMSHAPVRSYLAVPVMGGDGSVIGGIILGHPDPSVFSLEDEQLARGIASQASVAVENAHNYERAQREADERRRAYEQRDAVANALQVSLLPPRLPEGATVRFQGVYRSGRELVGGDFYDVFQLAPCDWGVVVGDVCGKGPEAASLTALARYTLRAAATLEADACNVLRVLNQVVLDDREHDQFCTGAFARISELGGGVLGAQIALGGHPPPLVRRRDGAVDVLDDTGTLLGVVRDVDIAEHRLDLEPGDCVVLYTDGISEARGASDLFGIPRLVEVVQEHEGDLATLADAIVDAAVRHGRSDRRDDIAVLTIEARAPEEA